MVPVAQSEVAAVDNAAIPLAGGAAAGLGTALSQHWPEYTMEAGGLAVFMLSVCSFGAALHLPGSPVVQAVMSAGERRILMAVASALTSLAIIYSPWGQQSGAHLNPSVTLTYFRLNKIEAWDAFFYVIFQFLGGILGVGVAALLLGRWIADPAVKYVVTVPGPGGPWPAFVSEFLMAFVLMNVVLHFSNHHRHFRYTPVVTATLVGIYAALASPISSMNPARTTASAVGAHLWSAAWIYFTAPPLGMLAAAEIFLLRKGQGSVFCAKLHHHNHKRCIFRCRFAELQSASPRNQAVLASQDS